MSAIERVCNLLSLGVVVVIVVRAVTLDEALLEEASSWVEWVKPWFGQGQR